MEIEVKFLGVLLLVVSLLYCMRSVRVFLRKIDTFYHEMSHGVFVILTGGKIKRITIERDESGKIEYTQGSFLAQTIILLAGYTGSSLISILTFYWMIQEQFTWLFWFYIISLVMGLIVYIRNWHGFFWASGFIALLAAGYVYAGMTYTSLLLVIIVLMHNLGSVIGGYTVFFLSIKQKENAGDAWALRKMWKLPTVLFGGLFFLESVCVIAANLYLIYDLHG